MGLAGEHEQNLWIERGCWQNLESKGVRAENSEGRSRNAEVTRVRAELSLLALVDEATSMTERQIGYIPPGVIFGNHQLSAKTRAKSWIERSCG
jgi:hypothetical protein